MKIGIKFNQLTYREYLYIIDRRRKYTDFNPLALYRSIIENNKLDLDQKIAIRELAHQHFFNFFEFLQVRCPQVYINVSTLGRTLTGVERDQLWEKVCNNGEKILKAKRIKHRNFGDYAISGLCFYSEEPVYVMSRPYYNYPNRRKRRRVKPVSEITRVRQNNPFATRVIRHNTVDIINESINDL